MTEVGFVWDLLEAAWEEQFAALTEYKESHGHCNVPKRWPDNPALAHWVGDQRSMNRKGCLPKERQRRLEALGFVWDSLEAKWEEQFAALVRYRQQHNHCNVPYNSPENLVLGHWVSEQRTVQRKGRLSSEKQRRLKALGFEWNTFEAQWEEQFAALAEYKEKHGDCNVSSISPQNPVLGRWVSTQRGKQWAGHLSQERQRRLEALGFEWRLRAKRKGGPHGKNHST
jgi:hypothetical protein